MQMSGHELKISLNIYLLVGVFSFFSGCEPVPRGPYNPRTANDYAKWAGYYGYHNDVNGAISSYTQAIDKATDMKSKCLYLRFRGICKHNEYRHLLDGNSPQDISGAEVDFSEAVRLCPDDIDARRNRAIFYTNTGQFDKGIKDYDVLILHDPDNPLNYTFRAIGYALEGDSEKALADANQAIKLRKAKKGLFSEAFYFRQRAWVRYKLKDVNGALADFDNSIGIGTDIDKCNSFIYKGDILEKEGRSEEALKVYEQGLKEVAGVPWEVPPGVIGGVAGGAVGVTQSLGHEALSSSTGVFWMSAGGGIGAVYGAVLSQDPRPNFREEAKRRIERIKSSQSSQSGLPSR